MLAGAVLSGTSNGVACDCNSTLKMEWSPSEANCVCRSGFFLNLAGVCTACNGTGNTGTSSAGKCICKSTAGFKWDDNNYVCICKDTFFLNGTICSPCFDLPGVDREPDLLYSYDGISCPCLPSITWNSALKRCVCKVGEFINADGKCGNCSKVAKSANTSNLVACNCLTGYFWWNNSCICKNGTFKSATGSCSPCSAVVGAKNSSNDEKCDCNSAAGFTWVGYKCVCNGSAFAFSGACKNCSSIPTSLGTSDGTKCSCKDGFTWSVNLATCVCNSTSYLKNDSTCASCVGMTGIMSPNSNGLACTCKTTSKFVWNPTLGGCFCLPNFYLSNNTCMTCVTRSNTNNSASAKPNTCGCKTNYTWNDGNYTCLRTVTMKFADSRKDCPQGLVWSDSEGRCDCGDDRAVISVDSTFLCVACPSGKANSFECNCEATLEWRGSYCGCAEGYFLLEDSKKCMRK